MSRRRGYGSGSNIRAKDARCEELDKADFLDLVLVAYTVSDGEADDIATQIERRVAIFRKDTFPDDPYPKPVEESSHYGYGYFEGLPQAEIDEPLDLVKDRDREALQHREESAQLMDKKTADYNRMIERVTFEDFLNAVETVKHDESDEEAWKIIDNWRTRKMRNEKVI